MRTLLAAVVFFVNSQIAFATFDAELLFGGASAKSEVLSDEPHKDGTASGGQVGLSLHFDPFMGVPIAFGAVYLNQSFSVDMETQKAKAFGGASVGPEIVAWVPTVSSFHPYIKGAYLLSGFSRTYDREATSSTLIDPETGAESNLTVEKHEAQTFYSGGGPRASAGVNWSILRHLNLMAEYSMTWISMHATRTKNMSSGEEQEISDASNQKITTQGLLLGVGGSI